MAGMAGMKKVTFTVAPATGPLPADNVTRMVFEPLWGGDGIVVISALPVVASACADVPPPGPGVGANDPAAAWSWLSESIRKLAEVTTRSLAVIPLRTT